MDKPVEKVWISAVGSSRRRKMFHCPKNRQTGRQGILPQEMSITNRYVIANHPYRQSARTPPKMQSLLQRPPLTMFDPP